MRLSHHGLVALADHPMRQDPLSGDLFAFIHRRHADDDTSDVGQSQCGDPGMLKKRISTLPE